MIDYENDPGYEQCLVTFFDVLGFQNHLRNKSAAEIKNMLSLFRQVSEGDAIPVSRSDEIRLASEAHTEIVSDAIVRSRTTETQYQIGPLVWEIIDLLHIQIECIANGFLVRGAMAIGPMHLGVNFEGPVFGPGLVQAFHMEESEVIFPRIAIHEDVITRHSRDENLWREGHGLGDEKSELNRLLRIDEAGLHYIDYLTASLGEVDGEYEGWIEFLERHRELIAQGLAEANIAKVRRKYNWLRNYHNEVIDRAIARIEPGSVASNGEEFEELLHNAKVDAD